VQVAIFAYEHMTALDAIGPYEVLSRLPGVETIVVGAQRGPVRCDTQSLGLVADATLDDVTSPDVLVVPGWSGSSQETLLRRGPVQDWLRAVDRHTTWTTSAGTGAVILATAGLLTGRRATTHWLRDQHARRGCRQPTEPDDLAGESEGSRPMPSRAP
jgi:putative intracellular protease/amidase